MLLATLPVAVGVAAFFLISAGAVTAVCLPTRSGAWRAALVLCSAFTITGLQLGALSPLLFAGAVLLWRVRRRSRRRHHTRSRRHGAFRGPVGAMTGARPAYASEGTR